MGLDSSHSVHLCSFNSFSWVRTGIRPLFLFSISIIKLRLVRFDHSFTGLVPLHSSCKFSRIDRDQAALLTEAKYPELNNSLINAAQLECHLTDHQKAPFSLSLIREQLQRTQTEIQKLDPDSVVSNQRAIPMRNIFIVTFLVLITVTAFFPGFWKPLSSNSHELTQAIENKNQADIKPFGQTGGISNRKPLSNLGVSRIHTFKKENPYTGIPQSFARNGSANRWQ